MSIENPNSTDATIGQPLRIRVEARIAELTAALEAATSSATLRSDLEIALSEVEPLLTGDRDHLPAVVAVDLNRWLEANKHLAEFHHRAPPTEAADPTEGLPAD